MKRILNIIIALVAFAVVVPSCTAKAGQESSKEVVKTGIDVLESNGFKQLQGKKIGLVTNPSGVNNKLVSTVDILANAPGVELVALYGPEHGVRGDIHAGDKVSDDVDPKTGVPVYSLYGKTRKPTPEMLKDVDAIVYDIQDNGCRSFTFISTLGLLMEAAAENGKEVIGLDRPNPLGGHKVEENSAIYKNAPHTLYAHWTMYGERTSAPVEEIEYPAGEEYTVSFECAETDDSFGDITCTGGVYSDLPAPTVPDGYKFAGWFTKMNGGKKADAGASLVEFNDHTLYAHFTPVADGEETKYTVSFDPDGTEVWVAQSTEFTPVGTSVGLYIDPENIHIMHKSGWHKHSEEELEEEGMM